MSSWSIRKSKKYGPISLLAENDKFQIEEWQKFVDDDDELIWEEDSQIAKDFENAGKEWIEKDRYKMQAYFDIRKRDNWPGLRFSFFRGTITAMSERQTVKRINKLWEITQYFRGYLFKNGIRFTEKKLEKFISKDIN